MAIRLKLTDSGRARHGVMAGIALCSFSFSPAEAAASYRLIYTFLGAPDSGHPSDGSSLIADGSGHLLGTTPGGGAGDLGAIYRLTKPASQGAPWTEEVLHSFNFLDGESPSTPLLLDGSGNMYGLTNGGGASNFGNVFKLTNASGWPITTLHDFGPRPDGAYPLTGGLSIGLDGLLYGSTSLGGYRDSSSALGHGTIFSISPLGDAVEYAVLHNFGMGTDGWYPLGQTFSPAGHLLGITQSGGSDESGMAFSLHPNVSGVWKEARINQFAAPGVRKPTVPPFLGTGSLGHSLYGCGPGGAYDAGVVYRLSPPPDGGTGWTQTTLYSFGTQPGDPSVPQTGYTCGLTQGADGKLYGTTGVGGINNDGAFFEVDPPASGATAWTETVLYSFNASGGRGYNPLGVPLRQGRTFYGIVATTSSGFGGVYQITP